MGLSYSSETSDFRCAQGSVSTRSKQSIWIQESEKVPWPGSLPPNCSSHKNPFTVMKLIYTIKKISTHYATVTVDIIFILKF